MVRGMGEVLRIAAAMEAPEDARRFITDCCNLLQEQAFADAGQLLNAVR